MAVPLRLAAAGLLGVSAARRWRDVRAVAPELRTPLTWVPLAVGGKLTLAAGRRLFVRATQPVEGVRVERADGAPAWVYRPETHETPRGALVWIHGGGTILGVAEADHELCSTIARDLGIVVVSVEYRLAPENPFPDGLDDCMQVLRWVHAQAGPLGIDTRRVAVGGASAGGGLAAALVQRAHDERNLPVAFQLLQYPMLDDRTVLRRDHGRRGRLAWTPRSNRFAWTCYLGRKPQAGHAPAYAAPARRTDLAGLPPAWIGVGDLDLFYAEDVDYAERLRTVGVAVETHIVRGMQHGVDVQLPTAPQVRALRASMFDALRRALTTRPDVSTH